MQLKISLPEGEKTWELFKTHFRKAAKNFKEFAGETTSQAGFTTQVVNDISANVANIIRSTGDANSTDTTAAETFMNEMATAVNTNQQLLPQLFE